MKKNVYSGHKIFHFKEKLDSLSPDNKKILPPLHIRLKPTNVCNHNCHYCAYRTDNLQLGKDMKISDFIPKDKMFELVDDFADMGVKAVTFSGGGEPFCYPFFLETLKKLQTNNIKFACLTNGSLLNGEVAEFFAEYGTWLRISIDGYDPTSYSKYRHVSEKEFPKIMSNIKDFAKKKGNCLFGVSMIVDQENAEHIYSLLQEFKNNGVQTVKVSPCIISNSSKENIKYQTPIYDIVRNQIDKSINDLQDKDFEIFDSYHWLDEKFDKKYSWCPYLQILPVVAADMNVYSCHDKAYNLDNGLLGSIKDKRFKKFWNENKERFFKINPEKDCNHHCVVNKLNENIHDYLNVDLEHLDFV